MTEYLQKLGLPQTQVQNYDQPICVILFQSIQRGRITGG